MSKRTIFLETAFWEGFSECPKSLASFAEGTDPVMNVERISKWNSIYKLLLRSDILIDTPLDRLADKASSDSFLRHLLKSNGDGKMALEYQEEPFPNLDRSEEFEYDDDYLALYFTGQEHHKGAQKHGVINVCLDDIWNQQNKFKDSGEAMRADTGWGWNSMDILKENSNSLVIIDNYIISVKANGYWSMRRDLKDLLGLILPYDSSCEYCISLFYLDKSVNDNERDNLKNLCSDTISSWIQNIITYEELIEKPKEEQQKLIESYYPNVN
ncbi:MAG: hypothetical protein IJ584_15230, partial [Bacteroidales bacterium]|nr:hypothetical protein [Bacteroidales bacterium]